MTESQFNLIAKALADPKRFALLQQISSTPAELPCKDLVQSAGVTPATISHHLKELTTAGLISSRKQGQCMYLSPNPDTLDQYLAQVRRRLLKPAKPARR